MGDSYIYAYGAYARVGPARDREMMAERTVAVRGAFEHLGYRAPIPFAMTWFADQTWGWRATRPAVNPWRHIATRQQHFKRAIEAHTFIPFTITGPRPTNRFQAYDAAQAAFDACRWGTP